MEQRAYTSVDTSAQREGGCALALLCHLRITLPSYPPPPLISSTSEATINQTVAENSEG